MTKTGPRTSGQTVQGWAVRGLLFVLCQPSGNAVLAEAWGIATLHDVFWYLALPSYVILFAAWWAMRGSANPALAEAAEGIAIGAVGGFLGTVAYDVIRIPFVIMGMRVFVPNDTYGLWILDAAYSTRFSETAGWAYHFANGTTFGIMYAMFMRGRHWLFGVAWAFLLEGIALWSPYGAIYHLAGDPLKIAVAFYGHIGYGVPLGLMVQRWEASARFLHGLSRPVALAIPVVLLAAVIGMLTAPSARTIDASATPRRFLVEDGMLTPGWLRLPGPGTVTFKNSCDATATVVIDGTTEIALAPCQEKAVDVATHGVRQVYVKTTAAKTRSSFILVEPVAREPTVRK